MILDASYHIENDSPVIDLYVKNGDSIDVERVTDVEPYFYVEKVPGESENDFLEHVAAFPQITRVEKTERKGTEPDNLYKVCTAVPADVPNVRMSIANSPTVKDVYEADILFTRRCFIDRGWVPLDGDVKQLNVAALDLEIHTEGAFPDAKKDPITIVSYADTKGLRTIITSKQTEFEPAEVVRNEKEIIQFIHELIKAQQPDIIVGYNSDNFDFPYIIKRAERYGIQLTWGFRGSPVKLDEFAGRTQCPIKGRPHIDLYPICRMAFNLPRYTLEDVYSHITGKEKIDLEHEEMIQAWNEGGELLTRFCDYALQDADATLAIADAVLPMYYKLSHILRLPIQDVSRMSSAQRVEHLLILETVKNGYIIPNKPSPDEKQKRLANRYEGAFVQEPDTGLHNHIFLVDYSSLYPSLIISYNVDPYRANCECCESIAVKSPIGTWFCTKKRGFISGILTNLLEQRTRVKDELSDEMNEQNRLMLDAEQKALKVLANAMYGYLGYPGARWYRHECASSITAYGRKYMSEMIQHCEEHGFKVIYGDTDSAFLKNIPEGPERDRVHSWLDEYNKTIPETMHLKFEGYFPRGIFITKKRYALVNEDGSLYIKGLETKRRDWAKIAKEAQQTVLDLVLKDDDIEGAAHFVLKEIERLKSGDVPLDNLVIHTQLTRDLREYTGNPMPHTEAIKKAMKLGHRFEVGDILQYIITRNGASISDRAQLRELTDEGDYDASYYVNNQFIPAVSRIMYAIGYDKDQLLGKGKQFKIHDWS